MKEHLVDEYLLHVCPTLTFGGRRLFTEGMNPTNLTLLDLKLYGAGTVFLKYQPSDRL
jgi:hypothetical protein